MPPCSSSSMDCLAEIIREQRIWWRVPCFRGAVSLLSPGDAVCLFNGDGREYPARVLDVQRRLVSIEVLDAIAPERELPFSMVVAAPLPKGDRAQFLVEKLTELGVTAYVTIST